MEHHIKQVVILSGGKGTRMRELTETIPKPMVQIGGIPVLQHLINIFDSFGKFEYIICTGYKSKIIENYFTSRENIKVINTGEETNTGGRLYKVKDMLEDNFLFTYGDGLANVNINKLIESHFVSNNVGTITVTNPTSRSGLVEFDENFIINKFIEKPKLTGFINMGFMIFNKLIFNYLNDNSILESDPLTKLSIDKKLNAYVHNGYFEPMDTYREYINLNRLWDSGEKPWMKF